MAQFIILRQTKNEWNEEESEKQNTRKKLSLSHFMFTNVERVKQHSVWFFHVWLIYAPLRITI